MDDYLSKPIDNAQLIKMLNLYLHQNAEATANLQESKSLAEKSSGEILDVQSIIDVLGVDEEIAHMVINLFIANIFKEIDEFETIIQTQNEHDISKKAHYIKNSCLNVNLKATCALLFELEQPSNFSHDEILNKFDAIKNQIIYACEMHQE